MGLSQHQARGLYEVPFGPDSQLQCRGVIVVAQTSSLWLGSNHSVMQRGQEGESC